MSPTDSLTPAYFDDVYGANEDPWSFRTSPYEREKYARTLAALPRPRYANAFEIGCSIGVLTRELAARCERLLSVDVSDKALQQARAACAGLDGVTFERREVPRTFPDAKFDLIVLSEVAYYWSTPDLKLARDQIVEHLSPGGHLLLVHWTAPVHDYPQTGDQVHDLFLEGGAPLTHLHGERHEKYRLDLFEKAAD